ncbi:MAG TPA: response regulator [Solirubrobacterales bacterium]|jgi:DNA-binding NarL/FixJ family response regulator
MSTITHTHPQAASADPAEVTTVLVVDDHQAVRLGIQMLLDDEPGIEVVASAGTYDAGFEEAARFLPDIAVVDYHLPDRDGLALTRRLVTMPTPPRVLVFSAYADERLALAALVAGADAVLGKNTLGIELCHLIEILARGDRCRIEVSTRVLAAVGEELEPEDRPILGMLAAGTDPGEIATVLGLTDDELSTRRSAMLRHVKGTPRITQRPASTQSKGDL